MERATRLLWATSSVIFVGIVVAFSLILLVLTIHSLGDLRDQPVEIAAFGSALWRYSTSQPLTEGDHTLIAVLSQPVILVVSVIVLFYPVFALVWGEVRKRTLVVETLVAKRRKNRLRTAERLSRDIKDASRVCIVSGNFSWFCENEAGLAAMKALVEHADHVTAISYKSIDEIRRGLQHVQDQSLVDQFAKMICCDARLRGVKLTIVERLGQRKLYMVSGTSDDSAEQLVIVKDVEYGRRLIDTFDELLKAAAR